MNPETISVLVGAVLVVTGAVGGGIELRELKIPPVKTPTRIIAFVAGIFFVLLGVGLKMEEKTAVAQTASVAPAPIPNEDAVPVSAPNRADDVRWLHSQLKSAILKASSTEAAARAHHDATILRIVYAGDALEKVAQEIETLAGQGLIADSRLHAQEGWEFHVSPDHQRAEVTLIETWSSRYRRLSDGECAAETQPVRVPQIVSLRRAGESWIVRDFNGTPEEPSLQPCTMQ